MHLNIIETINVYNTFFQRHYVQNTYSICFGFSGNMKVTIGLSVSLAVVTIAFTIFFVYVRLDRRKRPKDIEVCIREYYSSSLKRYCTAWKLLRMSERCMSRKTAKIR